MSRRYELWCSPDVGLEPRVQRDSWIARPRPVPQSGAEVWTGRATFERPEVPAMNKRTYLGLDVHARSVKGSKTPLEEQ